MDANLGHETDALNFLSAVSREPYRYDFYQTLRRLECLYPTRPRWGTALRPIDEPVRLGQEPELAFAPAPLASLDLGPEGAPPRLHVRLFGLLGPNGPMPIHITEYVRHRLRHANDPTLSRFLDLLHHRFIALFYRAWAQAQPHVNRDRAGQDRYKVYVGAFVGVAPSALRERDSVLDVAKLFHAGTLVRQVRNAEGLAAILRQFFGVPARVEEFVGHWMRLAKPDYTRLGRRGAGLGEGAVAGARVWDHQSKFRVHLGPLTLAQYESFLPVKTAGPEEKDASRSHLRKLVDWVRFYLCFELDWDVRLHLRREEVPALTLGRAGRLGWTTWLGRRRSTTDAGDLVLVAEASI
jgi:type VI secretion system protein ImpH